MGLYNKFSIKCSGMDAEELYFARQEEEKLKELRECALEEADQEYQEDHKYHCFRCGTPSLVEVDRGEYKIDVCVNEGCGAVHLDPGELDALLKEGGEGIHSIRSAIFAVFK
jgi:hypothetical protein